ncbi:MAG: hypothetical protein ACMUIU_18380 [bacterium]
MKRMDWKFSILAIFFAVCFSIYAGNGYPQELSTNRAQAFYNSIRAPIDSYLGYTYHLEYQSLWFDRWEYFYGYWRPSGITTFEYFQDKFPGLTYDKFYNMVDIPGIDYGYGYFNFTMPIENSLNVYQRPDIYALPLSQIHKLYYFTRDFPVQPIMPDIWVGFGGSMNMSNYGGGYL